MTDDEDIISFRHVRSRYEKWKMYEHRDQKLKDIGFLIKIIQRLTGNDSNEDVEDKRD